MIHDFNPKFLYVALIHYCTSTLNAQENKGKRETKPKRNILISERKFKSKISLQDFSHFFT